MQLLQLPNPGIGPCVIFDNCLIVCIKNNVLYETLNYIIKCIIIIFINTELFHIIAYDSSIDNEDEDSDNLLDCDDYDDYDSRFAKYKERVKAEEHFYYNSVLEDSSNGSSNSD